MSCFTIKTFLSAYPPIPSCQSASQTSKSGSPNSLRFFVGRLPKLSLIAKCGNANEATPKNKGQSIEDVLRHQIKSQEFYDGGGRGKDGFGGGGGGGGGKDGGGADGEDFSEALDEAMQVVLATLSFIFLYIYILDGPEINRYTRDIIRYLMGGKKSFRLQRLEEAWESDWKKIWTKRRVDPRWFGPLIMRTPTMYDTPTNILKLLSASEEAKKGRDGEEKGRDGVDEEEKGRDGVDEEEKRRDGFDEEENGRDGFDEDVGYRCDD